MLFNVQAALNYTIVFVLAKVRTATTKTNLQTTPLRADNDTTMIVQFTLPITTRQNRLVLTGRAV